MDDKLKFSLGTGLAMVALLVCSRLVPHPPNFTPVAAVGLFGAAWFSSRVLAFAIPFAALWLSNLVLDNVVYARLYPEFYEGFTWFSPHHLYIYGAFALIILMGMALLRQVKASNLLVCSLLGSLLFFAITNFGVWAFDPTGFYGKGAAGLAAAYTAGLPFLLNTLAGDLFYTALLFGTFAWMRRRSPALQHLAAKRAW